MRASKAKPRVLARLVLQQPVIAYAANKAQKARLIELGYLEKNIYQFGNGTESLQHGLNRFRGHLGTLAIASETRVFGDSRKEVMAAIKLIEAAGCKVHDHTNPDDCTLSDTISRALSAASGSARLRDRRKARRMGRDGGLSKGVAMQGRREAEVPAWMLQRIAQADIPWRAKAELTKGVCSAATLYRRYR